MFSLFILRSQPKMESSRLAPLKRLRQVIANQTSGDRVPAMQPEFRLVQVYMSVTTTVVQHPNSLFSYFKLPTFHFFCSGCEVVM